MKTPKLLHCLGKEDRSKASKKVNPARKEEKRGQPAAIETTAAMQGAAEEADKYSQKNQVAND